MNQSEHSEIFQLPDIITLEEYNGNFAAYFEGIYQIFVRDFIENRPMFEGIRLKLKSFPYTNGKEYTFYHFTHEGNVEENRVPDLRRMERIPWPAPMINDSGHPYLKVWRNNRGRHERILILHEQERYLIILEDRKDYILPWTAYLVDYPNKLKRLLREYEAYKNQNRPAN